jgi:hypothetical protein
LFVVDAHSNISVFDSLLIHSLFCVLEKHGNEVSLVGELASALFLMNGNDKACHAFKHLEELEMLLKENLTMYFANWCNSQFWKHLFQW